MGMMYVFVKAVKTYTNVGVLEVAYFRCVVMTFGCFFHARYKNVNVLDVPRDKALLIFLRSFFGFFSYVNSFIAVFLMPLSSATVIYFT
jgi:drug/metabolite transporter (DMT)-like permease